MLLSVSWWIYNLQYLCCVPIGRRTDQCRENNLPEIVSDGGTSTNRSIFIVQLSTSEPHRIRIAHYVGEFMFFELSVSWFRNRIFGKKYDNNAVAIFVWLPLTIELIWLHAVSSHRVQFFMCSGHETSILSPTISVPCAALKFMKNGTTWDGKAAAQLQRSTFNVVSKYITQRHEMIKPFGRWNKKETRWKRHIGAHSVRWQKGKLSTLAENWLVRMLWHNASCCHCHVLLCNNTLSKLISYICYETMRSILMFIFGKKVFKHRTNWTQTNSESNRSIDSSIFFTCSFRFVNYLRVISFYSDYAVKLLQIEATCGCFIFYK